ncbi:MAG TPA: carboxypeptidase regulatory-like domain-containing protein [Bryobacteraceae bacterium]|nr:carboxypeptidase regulatory-like domain-containing protein [Bryobacteraceae bacterium]
MPTKQICSALLFAVAFGASLSAQTATGSITGTVVDPTQAAVGTATVTLTNSGTSEVRTAQTNGSGYYSFQLLPPATYKLDVSSPGFQHFLVSSIPLNVGQVVAQNVSLKVGESSQTVTVTESGPQIESESSSLGTVLGNNSIVDLPINGRNSYGFAALVPGVRAPNLFTQVAYGNYNDQFLSINGSRVNVSMFYLDGGWNSNAGFNGPGIYPPIDLVQEYKVQTSNVPAEFGNTAGGVINVVTKSGTNQVHGSAYEFVRNDFFDATDFFANAAGQGKAPIRFNQFGAALGGPVYIPKVYDGRNKTFFFFAYEGLRWVRAYTTTGTMPTALQRAGDFSQTFNQAGQQIAVYNPNSTVLANGQYSRTPLPGNRMAISQINPVSLALVPYLPLPNATGNALTGTNNFTSTMSAPINQDNYSLRVDQKITDNQKLFVRWSRNTGTVERPDVYGNDNPNFAFSQPTNGTDLSHNQEAVVNYNIVVNPTTVVELSSSVLHYWLGRQNPALGFNPTQVGMPSYFNNVGLTSCFPSVAVSGMGATINVPDTGGGFIGDCQFTNQSYDTFSEYANVTKVRGSHTLKMGANWFYNRWSQRPQPASNNYSFSSDFTQGPNPVAASAASGVGFASFLFGTGDNGSIQSDSPGEFVGYHSYGVYFQDDWKVSPKLTLNLGLRYDFNAPWSEKYNRINNWNGNSTVVSQGVSFTGGLEFPGVNGLPTGQFQNNRTNFAPRFGFAYSPDSKTVVRGGFGMFYGPTNGAGFAGNMSPFTGFSASTNWISTVNGVTPVNLLNNPFPGGFQRAPGSSQGLLTLLGQTLETMDRSRLNLYSEQWNFGIERTLPGAFLLSAAYAGSHGVHLYSPVNYNQLPNQYLSMGNALLNLVPNPYFGAISSGPLSTATVQQGQLLRPYPQFQGITAESNSYGNSIYHSMQVKLERRFAHGVGMLLSYTYSKLIDDVLPSDTFSGFPGENFSAGAIQDSTNRRADRAVASYDTPNYLAINGNWELPFGHGKAFLNRGGWTNSLFGGWQLNGIFNFHTGAPLGLTTQTNTLYNYGAYGYNSNTERPNYVGGPIYTSGSVSSRVNDYFNTNAFALPAPFTYGDTGRLLPYLRAPGAVQLDMSLFKEIPIHERMHMQFRAEIFNLLNHPQFDAPNTVIGSPQAGVISSQVNSPRDIQLALKLLF